MQDSESETRGRKQGVPLRLQCDGESIPCLPPATQILLGASTFLDSTDRQDQTVGAQVELVC